MTKKDWGGKWTEVKLDVFEKYVKAYLIIMNNNRDKYGWKLIYFDAFAGSGSRINEQKKENEDALFDITIEDEKSYRGAAERVVNIDLRGFDTYNFIESDEESKLELEKKLNSIKIEKNLNLDFQIGDANNYIQKLSNLMKNNSNYRTLAMIDPFGMQVEWESIKQLQGTNTDLWILIPSGVIVNRLLDRSGKLTHIDKLVSFFGLSEKDIREHFYQNKKSGGLFDFENEVQKIPNPIQSIVELYRYQLKSIFQYVTPKPLVMFNNRNVPIYHFALASNNATAVKIANDIIGRKT